MMDVVTVNGNQFITAALGVSLALICLVVVLWVLKNRTTSSAFMRVVRSRNPRIQILDATPVDARRRLVLVRRDNVEHLIMIGGPTDLVIESRIGEDGERAREIDEELPQRLAPAAPQPRQLAEPAPAARVERPRPPTQPAAAQPARPAPPAARAPAPQRQAARQPEPAQQQMSAYQDQDHYDLDEDEGDNSFFYDEFYDEGPSEEEALADLLEASRERIFSDRDAPQPVPQRPSQPQQQAVQQQPGQRPARAPQQQFTPSDFERVLEEEIAQHMSQPEPPRMAQPRPAAPAAPARPAPSIAPARPVAPPLANRVGERRQPDTRPIDFQQMDDRRAIAAPPIPTRQPAPQALRPAAASAARPTAPMRAAAAIASAPAGRSSQPNLQNEIARIFGEMSSKREK